MIYSESHVNEGNVLLMSYIIHLFHRLSAGGRLVSTFEFEMPQLSWYDGGPLSSDKGNLMAVFVTIQISVAEVMLIPVGCLAIGVKVAVGVLLLEKKKDMTNNKIS